MANSQNNNNQVYLYALANPALIFEQRNAIQRAVFEALQILPSSQHRLTFSESSGWFSYTVLGELWERTPPPALPTAAEAQKAVRGLLARLAQKCSNANPNWPKRLNGIQFLPDLNPSGSAGLYAVPRPDGKAWDHWLYRAEPKLSLDGKGTRAGVFGAQIEIRIGHRGQPISINSHWRPLTGEKKRVQLSRFRSTPDASGTNNQHKKQPPVIKYLLEGDGIPQYYLAPYYFQSEGDDVRAQSASPFSLIVDIGRTNQQDSRMRLTALAQGGSGSYGYNWAVYTLDAVEQGYRVLGSGHLDPVDSLDGRASASTVDLDNGYYIVMLNVIDRRTGAFKHHQQQVFSSPFTSPPPLVS